MYWAGLLISNTGSQMQVWAIFWHLRVLSDDPIVVSGIGIAKFLPILLFALIGGLVADTFDRRRVVLITQTAMILIATALGLLTYFGHIQLWHMYILVAIQGIAVSFDGPSRQSMVPAIVPREDLPSAFGLQSIAADVGAVVGPALCGLVIATLGLQWIYWINAVSFLAVIIALINMGPIPSPRSLNINKTMNPFKRLNFAEIPAGIRFIMGHPIILSSMLLDFFATFFSSANTLMPFIATDVLHTDAIGYGWLSAAQSIGAVAVALFMAQANGVRKQGKLLLWGVGAFGVATAVFGLSRNYALTMLALIVVGAGDAISTVLRNTIRQLQTPDEMRGRMVSINQIFFAGGPQLGEVEAGIVASTLGTPFAIISGGIGCVLAVLFTAFRYPALRNYNGDEEVLAGAKG
ncbi:Enterobactin exporter EntS [bioreactor metagenome]|uniref:Enterobactin exporter EntS n=1 Tax=bioreactor metagenome TaxID=1076179 RepID=A0A644ZLW0_9ZZZZ